MRPASLVLILLSVPFQAHGQSEPICVDGTPEERLACFTRTHCPIVATQADRANCYRRITLDLLGIQSLSATAPATDAERATALAATPATNQTTIQATVDPISSTSSVSTTTTTAEQISEQNRVASVSASEEIDNFGYEWHETPQDKKKVTKEINSQIVFLDTLVQGNYLIGLENGQLWLQVSKTRTRLKTGNKVRIVRGSLRSFKLFPEKSPATYVTRVVCHGDDPSSLCLLFEDWQQAQD